MHSCLTRNSQSWNSFRVAIRLYKFQGLEWRRSRIKSTLKLKFLFDMKSSLFGLCLHSTSFRKQIINIYFSYLFLLTYENLIRLETDFVYKSDWFLSSIKLCLLLIFVFNFLQPFWLKFCSKLDLSIWFYNFGLWAMTTYFKKYVIYLVYLIL